MAPIKFLKVPLQSLDAVKLLKFQQTSLLYEAQRTQNHFQSEQSSVGKCENTV